MTILLPGSRPLSLRTELLRTARTSKETEPPSFRFTTPSMPESLRSLRPLSEESSSTTKQTEALTQAQIAKARLSPVDFAEVASRGWYKRARHLTLLNEKLLACAERKIKRLMVFMPPRHSKSATISWFTPPWWLGKFPEDNVIVTSYGQELADEWGRLARDTMEEYGGPVFGLTVSDDTSARKRWVVEGHRGGFRAAGIGSGITGRGADLLIIDDPVKNETEAFSATIHQRNIEWWASTASTRLEPNGVVILMMTRWHPNDLAGFLLGEDEPWEVLSLPALASGDDELGRAEGEALWPARYDEGALEVIRQRNQRILGGYYWNAMYQQKPELPEGLLFFDKQTCEYGRDHTEEPRERKETAPMPGATADGYVLVWERAVTGERYYIGADTADGNGETLGTWSEVGGPDRNCAAVYRARDDVQVAEIYGRQEEHAYARLLDQWGRYYNQAYLAVERNRRSVLIALRQLEYPNLYYTEKASDMHVAQVVNLPRAIEWGWNTDVKTRPILLAEFREAVSTGAIKPRSRALWDEALSFMHGDPPAAAPGQHDDRIFAHAIAWQAKKRLGRSTALQRNGGLQHMGTRITLGG